MTQPTKYQKIGALENVEQFKNYCAELGIDLPCDDEILSEEQGSPMAQPLKIGKFTETRNRELKQIVHAKRRGLLLV